MMEVTMMGSCSVIVVNRSNDDVNRLIDEG